MGLSKSIRAPLTIRSKIGLSKSMVQAAIEKADVIIFK